eukprot:Nitzschia sp. Nitz4//scaffold5_size260463//179735//181285//NITZ4_001003-RA/size260463-processed-gene-0.140-mRNA-1//-1//CDS//3329555403//816//frame0
MKFLGTTISLCLVLPASSFVPMVPSGMLTKVAPLWESTAVAEPEAEPTMSVVADSTETPSETVTLPPPSESTDAVADSAETPTESETVPPVESSTEVEAPTPEAAEPAAEPATEPAAETPAVAEASESSSTGSEIDDVKELSDFLSSLELQNSNNAKEGSAGDQDSGRVYKTERFAVYVGNIPFDLTTDDLIGLIPMDIQVKYVRIPMTKGDSPVNRGFGFVDVFTQEAVERVVKCLDGSVIGGRMLKASAVSEAGQPKFLNRRKPTDTSKQVFVKNVHFDCSEASMAEVFQEYGTVKSVSIPRNFNGKGRGYAFVEMADIAASEVSKLADGTILMERRLSVFESHNDERRQPLSGIGWQTGTSIQITNLAKSLTEETLTTLFSQYGQVFRCRILVSPKYKKSIGVGYVAMDSTSAEAAIQAMNGAELEGQVIVVQEETE